MSDGAPDPSGEAQLWRFLLPSLCGAVAFLLPIHYDGAWTIVLGVAKDNLRALVGAAMPWFLLGIVSTSAVVSAVVSLRGGSAADQSPTIRRLFRVSRIWLALRICGALCAWMIVFEVGPEFVWHADTGGVAFHGLASDIVTIFLCAAFLLPLLTEYGLMEFFGTLLERPFKTLFTLPGRAAVDALASWLSAAAVGVIITIDQYTRGQYSRREAAVIACNFSITSLPFCVVVIEFIGLREQFFPVYATVVLIGICCATLLPRLPPLSRLPDSYCEDADRAPAADAGGHDGGSRWQLALRRASERAALGPGLRQYLWTSTQQVLDIWMGLLPIVIMAGTLGLAVALFTPIMELLAAPLVPLLSAVGLPEAARAAPTFIVGFLDMFLPAALGQGIESERTRFVIASVSLTQLIYLSEVGALLLRSNLKLGLWRLLAVFLSRTAVGLPVALSMAALLLP